MAESTLSETRTGLRREIAHYLGYSRDTTTWTTDESTELDYIITQGLRSYYNHPTVPQWPGHEWSFLKPTASLVVTEDIWQYQLPDDYAGIIGDLTFGSSQASPSVRVISELQIRQMRQLGTSSGIPQYAAIVPLASTGIMGQRFQLQLYPTPSGTYTLTYKYTSAPYALTATLLYPLGGVNHIEGILASCLAVAERIKNDEQGVQWAHFMRTLEANIARDSAQGPETLGYNGDPKRGRIYPVIRSGGYNGATY